MPQFKPMFIGKDAILSAFDSYCTSGVYSVWISSNTMLYSWNKADKVGGRELLEQTLDGGEENNDTNIIYIKIHPEVDAKFIKSNTPVTATMICQIVASTAGNSSVAVSGNNALELYKMEVKIDNLNRQIEQLLQEKTAAATAVNIDDQEYDEPHDTIGRITTILEHPVVIKLSENPQIQTLIGKLAAYIADSIPAIMKRPDQSLLRQVAGVGEEPGQQTEQQPEHVVNLDNAKLTADLNRLLPHCDLNEVISKLADLAEQKPFIFSAALTELKKY